MTPTLNTHALPNGLRFRTRPTWENLLRLGVSALTVSAFVIARRPLVWNFVSYPVGGSVPSDLPSHRLRQLYRMRLIDAKPQTLVDLMNTRMRRYAPKVSPAAPRPQRKGGVVAAVVPNFDAGSPSSSNAPTSNAGGYRPSRTSTRQKG